MAQIGRRIAERCVRDQPEESNYLGIDPEVVEAACLAHDLGHPPFGHIGEDVLQKLVTAQGDKDGFEGNAQSFRILVKLSLRFEKVPGLDLTRATLAACLKYPWHRDPKKKERSKKWGAYRTEAEEFSFARKKVNHNTKTAEAEIMDWADDVAYSVHDLEDFHRCGVIPWTSIMNDRGIQQKIIERAAEKWFGGPPDADKVLSDAFKRVKEHLDSSYNLEEQYEGTREHRLQLRTMTSDFIGLYGKALTLRKRSEIKKGEPLVNIGEEEEQEVRILKQITRDYIIEHPSLLAQQKGQKRIIEDIFNWIIADSSGKPPDYLPKRLRYMWDDDIFNSDARAAADCVSSLTESEIVGLHNRLSGALSGSVLDPIVR